jgi:hypothetical protein
VRVVARQQESAVAGTLATSPVETRVQGRGPGKRIVAALTERLRATGPAGAYVMSC